MYNVLIIDDEPWSRQVVRSLGDWKGLGLAVVGEAEDGREGLRLIEELRPEIVVSDMRMPGLEGVELLQAMNQHFPTVKIVVMSGYDDFAYLQQAIKSRAVNYLLKPIDPDELNASLVQCVSRLDAEAAAGQSTTASASRHTPPVQLDTAVLERYAAYRKTVYGYMLELNAQAIPALFQSMGTYLEQALKGTDALAGIPSKIAYDYKMLLEEYLASVSLTLEQVVEGHEDIQPRIEAQASVPEAAQEVGRILQAALLAIQEIRQSKARLSISEVAAYIDRHYLEAISLETLAHQFSVSKEHLSRSYKGGTGENVSDAIQRKRMEKARDLILADRMSIKHAAELTGYADIAYFYRVFKKHFGFTPGELRKD
ncbi:response regulator transcription factor [Gorillibacterium massiliense]|uniref:response regulator transcription factor n=1 Tax=Gorillibacterium massiliense TaxID=1280390 RepID=UPI0004B41825|nr:response regulator [Gorillibacterium massiliense]